MALTELRRKLAQLRAKLHLRLGLPGEPVALLDYPRHPIKIGVSSPMEYHTRLHSCAKEPETVRWIEEGLSPGDVLYDIGANVGVYTLVAAARWGEQIKIVAIEPSPVNFARLVRNLTLNRFEGRVTPLPVALADKTGILTFHCENMTAGGSLHALGEPVNYRGEKFTPAASIPMLSYTLDELVEQFKLPEPTHLKLDVDGTEMAILRGAQKSLRSIKSVVVEVDDHRADGSAIQAILEENGLRVAGRFPYLYGSKFPQFNGISNVIFQRKGALASEGRTHDSTPAREMVPVDPQDQEAKIGQAAFQYLHDIFITPEVQRRQEAGELPSPLDLLAAQIIFYPDGRQPAVRINTEVKAEAAAMLPNDKARAVGSPARLSEIEDVTDIVLTDEDDPDCGHATMLRIKNKWVLVFDFRYNKNLAKKHLEGAKQFYRAAEGSAIRSDWKVFADTLFSAAELAVKATLLSMPDPEFRKKTSHGTIQSRYNRFASLGNAKPEYRDVFNKLRALRQPARYMDGEVTFDEKGAKRLLEIIGNMIADASARMEMRVLKPPILN